MLAFGTKYKPLLAAGDAYLSLGWNGDATGNQSAFELLDEEMCNDPSTYPAQDVIRKLEAGMPLDGAGQQRREELWKEVKR